MQKALIFTPNNLQTISTALVDLGFQTEQEATKLDEAAGDIVGERAKGYYALANGIRYYLQFEYSGSGEVKTALVFDPEELDSMARAIMAAQHRAEAAASGKAKEGTEPAQRKLYREQAEAYGKLAETIKIHLERENDQ